MHIYRERSYKEIFQDFEKFRLNNETHLWRLHQYHLDNDAMPQQLHALFLEARDLLLTKPDENDSETANLKAMTIYLPIWLVFRGFSKKQNNPWLPLYLEQIIRNLKPFKRALLTHCNNESFFTMLYYCIEPYLAAENAIHEQHFETLMDYFENAQCDTWEMKAICFRNFCKIHQCKLTAAQDEQVLKKVESLFDQYSTMAEEIRPTSTSPIASIISNFGHLKIVQNLINTDLGRNIAWQRTFLSQTSAFSRIFDYVETSQKQIDWCVPYTEALHFFKTQIKIFISALKAHIHYNDKYQLVIECESLIVKLGELIEKGKTAIQAFKNRKLEIENYHTVKNILLFQIDDSEQLIYQFQCILLKWNQEHPIKPDLKNYQNMQALIARQITSGFNQLLKNNIGWSFEPDEKSFQFLYALLEAIKHSPGAPTPATSTMQIYMKVFFANFLQQNEASRFFERQSSKNSEFADFQYPALLQESFETLKAGANNAYFSRDPVFFRMLEGLVKVVSWHKEKNAGYNHRSAIELIVSYFPGKKKTPAAADLEIAEIVNKIHINIYLLFFYQLENKFLESSFKYVQNYMSSKKALLNQQKNTVELAFKSNYLSDLDAFFQMELLRSSLDKKLSFREDVKIWNKYFPQLFEILKETSMLPLHNYYNVLLICFSTQRAIRNRFFEISKPDLLDISDLKQISTILLKSFLPLDKCQKKNLIDSFSGISRDMKNLYDLGLNNRKIMQQTEIADKLASSERALQYWDDIIRLMTQCCPSGKEIIAPAKACDYASIDLNLYKTGNIAGKKALFLKVETKNVQPTLIHPEKSIPNKPETRRAVNLPNLESDFMALHKTFHAHEPFEQILPLEMLEKILEQLSEIENQIKNFKGKVTRQWESLKINVFCTKIQVFLACNNEKKHEGIRNYCNKIMNLITNYAKKSNIKNTGQAPAFEFDFHVHAKILFCFETVLLKISASKMQDTILGFLHQLLDYNLSPFAHMMILELRSRYIKLSMNEMHLSKTASRHPVPEENASIYAKLLLCNLNARDIRKKNWSENSKFGPKNSDGVPLVKQIPLQPEYYLKAVGTWKTDCFLPVIQALSKKNLGEIHHNSEQALWVKTSITLLLSRLEEEINTLICLSEKPDLPSAFLEAVNNNINILKNCVSDILALLGETESISKDFFPLWRKSILDSGFDKKQSEEANLKSCIATMNERCEHVWQELEKCLHTNNLDKIRVLKALLSSLKNTLESQSHKYHFSDALASIDLKLTLVDSRIASSLYEQERAEELLKQVENKFLDRVKCTTFQNDRILQKLMLEFYAKKLQEASIDDAKVVISKITQIIESSAIPGCRKIAAQHLDYYLKIHRFSMPEVYISVQNIISTGTEKVKPDNFEVLDSFYTLYLLTGYISADKVIRANILNRGLNTYFTEWKALHSIYFVPSISKLQNQAWHSLHTFKMEFHCILRLLTVIMNENSDLFRFIQELIDVSAANIAMAKEPLNYITEHVETLVEIISNAKNALEATDYSESILSLEAKISRQKEICVNLRKQVSKKILTEQLQFQKASAQAESSGLKLISRIEQELLDRKKKMTSVPDEDYDLFDETPESDDEEDLPAENIPAQALKDAQVLDQAISNALRELNLILARTCRTYQRRIGHVVPLYVKYADAIHEDLQTIFSLYNRVVEYYKKILQLNDPEFDNNPSIQAGIVFLREYLKKSIRTINKRIDSLLKYARECHEVNQNNLEKKIWSLGIAFFVSQRKDASQSISAAGLPANQNTAIDAETLRRLQNNSESVDAATRALVINAGQQAFIALGQKNKKDFIETSIYHRERELFKAMTPFFASIDYCYKGSTTAEPGRIEIPYHYFKKYNDNKKRRILTKDDYKDVLNMVSLPAKPGGTAISRLHQAEFGNFKYMTNAMTEAIRSKGINFNTVRIMLAEYHEIFNIYKKYIHMKSGSLLKGRIDPLLDALNKKIFEDYLGFIHENYIAAHNNTNGIETEAEVFYENSLPFLWALAFFHDEINALQGKDQSLAPSARLHFFPNWEPIDADYLLAEAIRFICETKAFNAPLIESAIRHYQLARKSSGDPLQIAKIRYAVLGLNLKILESGLVKTAESYETLLKEFYEISVFVMKEIREFHSGQILMTISQECYHNLYSAAIERADSRILKNLIDLYSGLAATPMRYDLLMMDPHILHCSMLEMKRALLLRYPRNADFSKNTLLKEYRTFAILLQHEGNVNPLLLERAESVIQALSEEKSKAFFEKKSKGELLRHVSLPHWLIPIFSDLKKAGHTTFLVGGTVRRLLSRQTPILKNDLDFVIFKPNPAELRKLGYRQSPHLADLWTGSVYINGQSIPVDIRIVEPLCETKNWLQADMSKNDFTIAFYCNIHGQVIPVNSQSFYHLENKILATNGDPVKILSKDPVRNLRGLHFFMEGYKGDPLQQLEQKIRDWTPGEDFYSQKGHLYSKLQKLMYQWDREWETMSPPNGKNALDFVKLLQEFGLLKKIFGISFQENWTETLVEVRQTLAGFLKSGRTKSHQEQYGLIRFLSRNKQPLPTVEDEEQKQKAAFLPYGGKKQGSRTSDDLPENRRLEAKQRKRSASHSGL